MASLNYTPEQLNGMKRGELQKLAKSIGIKANAKSVVIIEQLKQYYAKTGLAALPASPAFSQQSSEQSFKLVVPQDCPNPEELAEAIIDEMRRKTAGVTQKRPMAIDSPVQCIQLTPRKSVLSRDSVASMKEKMIDLEEKRNSMTPRLSSLRNSQLNTKKSTLHEDMEDIQMELNKRIAEKIDRKSAIIEQKAKSRKEEMEKSVKDRKKKVAKGTKMDFDRIHSRHFSKLQSVADYHKKARTPLKAQPTRIPNPKPQISRPLPRVAMLAIKPKVQKGVVQKKNIKPKFDLKTSLAKKLTYTPYKGTLKKTSNENKAPIVSKQ